jgi:uncharacterized protein YndB with AHSA1/START domain
MATQGTRTLSHQYLIRALPDRAFEAISSAAGLTRWLSDRAEITPRNGGDYTLGWNDGPTHRGKVLEFIPGRRITLSWNWEGVEIEGTRFTLAVEPAEEGTLLKVEHSGFPRDEQWVDLYAGAEWGWTYFAMNLKSVLECGHDLRSRSDA